MSNELSIGTPGQTVNSPSWWEKRRAQALARGDMRDHPQEFTAVAEQIVYPVLDVGCAFGELCEYIDGTYIGIDISRLSIEVARQRHPRYVFLYGDGLALGSGWHKAFGSVFAGQLVEHYENTREVLRKLRALARERVIISVPRHVPDALEAEVAGHVKGWQTHEECAEAFADRGSLEWHPFEGKPNHLCGVLTW